MNFHLLLRWDLVVLPNCRPRLFARPNFLQSLIVHPSQVLVLVARPVLVLPNLHLAVVAPVLLVLPNLHLAVVAPVLLVLPILHLALVAPLLLVLPIRQAVLARAVLPNHYLAEAVPLAMPRAACPNCHQKRAVLPIHCLVAVVRPIRI